MKFEELCNSFKRSWIQHTGMQIATLSVLAATFTVIVFTAAVSRNLQNVLAHWGESVQLTAYLSEQTSEEDVTRLQSMIERNDAVGNVEFTTREQATASFKEHMDAHAPDLLSDEEFSNPFPASFQIRLKKVVQGQEDYQRLEALAREIGTLTGIDDVSYGQSWVQNYSAFVSALTSGGWLMIFILMGGALFVTGNSIRSSINARREEIEILELVGATPGMIRWPFIFEGAVMGLMASLIALILNYALHLGEMELIKTNLAFLRLSSSVSFLGPVWIVCVLLSGAMVGAIGAWLTMRELNDGWAASHGIDA